MPKEPDYVYSVDDIHDDYYNPHQYKIRLSFLAPAESVSEFLSLCEDQKTYHWETLEILLRIAANRRVIQLRNESARE